MGYKNLEHCLNDLDKNGQLLKIKAEVDPNLEMAAMHLLVFEKQGPALLFENVKGSKFRAASNIFGTIDRSRFMFRDTFEVIQKLVKLKNDPTAIFNDFFKNLAVPFVAIKALPSKVWFNKSSYFEECSIEDIPLIKHWPMDGGPFVTLPVVYTEDPDKPGIMNSNVGMYRIQLAGNEYELNKEIGLHYQLHRGIGVHQTKWNERGKPMKVSIFVGGPPSQIFAGVMPLPEGLSELTFAGALGNRRFKYFYDDEGFCLSADADFVITGEVYPGENKPEGPFGDHLGYYSLKHDFPLMKVKKVYHRKNAIWPFTVVGRPPQEDTSFGALVHELTGAAIPDEIPGLHAVHAVDASGVHPLLLAIGSERYTPYNPTQRPAELLTLSNHILGFGQLSLAKFLLIANKKDNPNLDVYDAEAFFKHILERIDLMRDLHFHTQTSIDTLDYSGDGLNTGSKVVLAAVGKPIRELGSEKPSINWPSFVEKVTVVSAGILAIQIDKYQKSLVADRLEALNQHVGSNFEQLQAQFPIWVLCDDAEFLAQKFNNFLWVTFTRSNPSHDIHGIQEKTINKHWGCEGPLLIDARIKPHHAPPVEMDKKVLESAAQKLEQAGFKL